MSSMWWMAVAAGIEDGFGPAAQISCALFLSLFLLLEWANLPPGRYLINCVSSVIVFNVLFKSGFLSPVYIQPLFQSIALILNCLFAGLALISGFFYAHEWLCVVRAKPGIKVKILESIWAIKTLIAVMVFILSITSTVWPMDAYFNIMTTNLASPGKLLENILIFAVYTVAEFWLLLLIAILFLTHKIPKRLQYVIGAAISLSAGMSVIIFLLRELI